MYNRESNAPQGLAGGLAVASALDMQEKATHELLEVVKVLASRLQPVLAPSPEKNAAGATGAAHVSQIATCVQQNTDRVRQASQVLSALVRDLAI